MCASIAAMQRARSKAVFVMVSGLLLAGCSAIIDVDKAKLGARPTTCKPSETAPCPCPDGTTSVQVCNTLARYDSCQCAAAAGAGAAGGGGAGSRP